MKKLPFDFEKFYWGCHRFAYYISEPVTTRANLQAVDVYARSRDDVGTILKELKHYSTLAIERNSLNSTHFRILY